MKQFLLATLTAVFAVVPVGAKPYPVVNPTEKMVLVPGLEFVGPSRISTVEFCAEVVEVADWKSLITDAELENFEVCLREQT